MRKLMSAFAVILALAVIAPAQSQWTDNYSKAVEMSKKTGKPILAFFTGSDWCSWCKKLKAEVLDTKEFAAWAKSHVILLEVDFPQAKKQSDSLKKQNMALKNKYNSHVPGFPTVLFLSSNGKLLGEYGYKEGGPKKWTAKADTMIKKS